MLKTRRPMGRLFHWFVLVAVLGVIPQVRAAGPNTTTVADVIYRADGTPAQGTLLISWPAFATKQGEAVASGTKSVKIGAGGSVRIALAPNTGSLPAGTHYKVTLKLDDGTTDTEYWVVPDSGETSVAAMRSKVVPAAAAAQFVTRDYIDSALAGVSGGMVVHKSGDEAVAGVKTFAVPPVVPAPSSANEAANKSYVDAADAAGKSYSDAVAATKANESTVLHNSGNEAVAGVKTFAASPAVPSPTAGFDAANKSYVDASDATGKMYTDASSAAVRAYADTVATGAKNYTDTAVAAARSYADTKALDAGVLHKSGDEMVAGVKSFLVPPVVPSPANEQDAANKAYVDAATRNAGSGVSLKTNGVANSSQTVLDLKAGSNISLLDSGTGSVTIQASGVAGPQGPAGGPFQGVVQVDGTSVANIQAGIAAAGTDKSVLIPANYAGKDTFTNPNHVPVLDMRRLGDFRGGRVSVRDFGAVGGGYFYGAVSMTSGSAVVSFPVGLSFWTGQRYPAVGQDVRVSGAGAAGADLVAHIAGIGATTLTLDVSASTTVSSRGIIWGWKTDNSAAIQAAVDYCYSIGGCTIDVPADFYGMNTKVTLPANNHSGRIEFSCSGGRQSTWFGWTGMNQGTMFEAPANSVPMGVEGCAFTSVDYNQRRAIAIAWLGGTEHYAVDNYFGDLFEGIRASMTWSNKIEFNRFYSCAANAAVHFGPAGNGPVNDSKVLNNEFGCYGAYGMLNDSDGAGGSNGNSYRDNDFEGTTPTTIADIWISESAATFDGNRFETGGSSVAGYISVLLGLGNSLIRGPNLVGSIKLTGSYNTLIIPTSGSVQDTGGGNTYYGLAMPSGAGAATARVTFNPAAPGPIGATSASSGKFTNIDLTDPSWGAHIISNNASGFSMWGQYVNGTGIGFLLSAWLPENSSGALTDNASDVGSTTYRLRSGYFGTKVRVPTVELVSKASYTCDASTRGQFNYIAGAAGVKDTVQVCAKDASDAYAWRPVY